MSRNYIKIIRGSGLDVNGRSLARFWSLLKLGIGFMRVIILFSLLLYTVEIFIIKKCFRSINQRWLILTSAGIFYYNVRDFKQFQRKGHLPIRCNGLEEARKKGSACHLQEKMGNCTG